jgi:2-dehydropantoate 2-reductase
MKICMFGAGAIGAFIGGYLARLPDVQVSCVARGAHLDAIRRNGVTVEGPEGRFTVQVTATDDPSELGPQDYVFITLKQQQVEAALDSMRPLLGPETAVLPPTTGIPYWYFHGNAKFPGHRLETLDPGGRQWAALPPERVIGCVYLVATEVTAPGVIHYDGAWLQFPLGEPDGSQSPRVQRLSDALERSGLRAPVASDIRGWIWLKMISSLCWNPVATLTLATFGQMIEEPRIFALVTRMMAEADAVAAAFDITLPLSTEARIGGARSAPQHKMSMLQDLERGRPLEIDPLADSIKAMRELVGLETPTIDAVTALTRLRAATAL